MASYVVRGESAPLVIGSSGLEDVLQCVRLIILTYIGSVCLDRSFAGDGSYIDTPSPFATARAMASLIEVIEAKEPRVRVEGVEFETIPVTELADGRLVPVVTITIKPGVTL